MLLDMVADGLGDRVAVGAGGDGITFSVLRDRARAVAADIPEGVHALASLEPTSVHTPVALFGAAWAGVSYAPLNFRLPAAARAEMLERIQPAVVFDPASGGVSSTDVFPDEPANPAVLLFTSGTSAAPKAAVLEHDQLLAYQFNQVEFASAGDEEANLLSVPPFHIAGVAAILTSAYTGRRVVPLPTFDADLWVETARAEGITHSFLVPTMLARIVDALERDPSRAPSTLRALSYGGARMPMPVLERALALLPDVSFVNAYGLTETSATVCILGPDDHRIAFASDDPEVRARLASAGLPAPGIEVCVVAATGEPVEPGITGEIRLRGAQVSGAYVDGGTRRDADGWLATGDFGWLDTDGYLFVTGRGDDTIIRGGENIAVAEVEDALLQHPSVGAAAVVGLPDEEWGERIGAMVATRAGAAVTADELRIFVRDRLGSLKTPSDLVVRDALPQTATGKILHRAIREELASPSPHTGRTRA